jgi:hypothetical protein
MSDVVFIAVMIVFFVLCTLYVQLCDRMIGSDELALAAKGADPELDTETPTLISSSAGTSEVTP